MNGNVDLRTLFGRPELIVKEPLGEVYSLKAITAENMVSIMSSSMVVSTMSSVKLFDHLQNPWLLEDLVGKLSSSLK